MADGGNVEFVEIDGPVVFLRLAGACGSCPSSLTTMTMGIKRRLMERIPVRCGGAARGGGGRVGQRVDAPKAMEAAAAAVDWEPQLAPSPGARAGCWYGCSDT